MAATPQLTLDNLNDARARVPMPVWAALTAMQQRYVAARILDPARTQGDCAAIAGMSAKRARTGGASAMENHAKVRAALDGIRADAAERTATDAVYVVRRLRENDEWAVRDKNVRASNEALGLLGKATGAFEKRVRIIVDDPATMLAQLKAMPPAERARVVRTMLEGGAA